MKKKDAYRLVKEAQINRVLFDVLDKHFDGNECVVLEPFVSNRFFISDPEKKSNDKQFFLFTLHGHFEA